MKTIQFGRIVQHLMLILVALLLGACASAPDRDPLMAANQLTVGASQYAGNEEYIGLLYASRAWAPPRFLTVDTVELGKRMRTPIHGADTKLLGPDREDALRALALKIWMIENAEHTIDVVYYIYSNDLVGQAVLGALCDAVQRGVDVRLMVDAIGSWSMSHNNIRRLQECALDAGYMRDVNGKLTPYKARVQTVLINAMTRRIDLVNRRSHDKMLLVDATFPGKDLLVTGGRNISLDYYGIHKDGSPDLSAYRDVELVVRSRKGSSWGDLRAGDVSEIYYDLLFLHKGNAKLFRMAPEPSSVTADIQAVGKGAYPSAQDALATLKSFPDIQRMLADMPTYLQRDFRQSDVRLAHELGNLTSRGAVSRTQENLAENQNSIMRIIAELGDRKKDVSAIRIVSPYMFLARYYDKDGNMVQDDAESILQWLAENPSSRIEMITNSVLTSDNFMAQSIIDMDTAPRLLLPPELQSAWLKASEKGEVPLALGQSDAWQTLINNSRVFIYQTGRLDSMYFEGGDTEYGKLHAKYIAADGNGFVGTANFDYRSRLFNNEMGFFYKDPQLNNDLIEIFEFLKSTSYRWGSPEWLEMRRKVMESGGMKAWSTRHQRGIYNFLKSTGLHWLI